MIMRKELKLKNQVGELEHVNRFIEEIGEELGLDMELQMNLNLVMEEMVSNVIFYAYPEGKTAEIELVAEVDGKIVGTAGVDLVRAAEKTRHRASFGISIDQAFWGIGIGWSLTNACIECAKTAGYSQIELEVVADNIRALALYQCAGYVEYGRNPRGFRSRKSGWQETVLMRRELDC